MATTKTQGRIGTWAEEAEREEAEQKERAAAEAASAAANVTKQRKKKSQTFSISEISTGQYVGHGGRSRPLPDTTIFSSSERNAPNRSEDRALGVAVGGGGTWDRKLREQREFAPLAPPSRADQVDDWASTKKTVDRRPGVDSQGERRRFPSTDRTLAPVESLAPDSKPAEQQTRVSRSDPFAGARPREQVLAEKKGDLVEAAKVGSDEDGDKVSGDKDGDNGEDRVSKDKDGGCGELNVVDSRQSSSSRPSTPGGPEVESTAVPRQKKVNPFGDAKPREVLLAERGFDWRKMDLQLEHRSVVRTESEEERKLKEEMIALENLIKNSDEGDSGKAAQGIGLMSDTEHLNSLRAELTQKERELQELSLALDDKVRFPQKQVDRPSSRSGRSDYSGKAAPGLERVDISRGYMLERPRSSLVSGEMTREYDVERPSYSSRDRDISHGFESERHGGMLTGYDRLDVRGPGLDRLGSRSGSVDFPVGHHVNRSGIRSGRGFTAGSDVDCSGSGPGYSDFFEGNGSERPRSNSGHVDFTRGYASERLDFRSRRGNVTRYDSERPGTVLGSRRSDARGYEPERPGSGSWHGDVRGYDSERPGSGSWQGDVQWYESARPGSNSGRSDISRGSGPDRTGSLAGRGLSVRGVNDFEKPGTYSSHNETPRRGGVFDRLGPMPAHRELQRPFDAGRLGSKPGYADAYRGFDETMGWHSASEVSGRLNEPRSSHIAHEPERIEPRTSRADTGRTYESHRGSERRNNERFAYNRGGHNGDDFNRRGNHGQQEYQRRRNNGLQGKFDHGRGIDVDHW